MQYASTWDVCGILFYDCKKSWQVMPYPLVYVVGGADGFGHFGKGAFDEGAELFFRILAKDKDVLRTVEVIARYLRIIGQELFAVEEGFEGAARQAGLSLLADVDNAARAGKAVEVLGIGELLRRRAGDNEIAREAFGFKACAEALQRAGAGFGRAAEEASGVVVGGLGFRLSEVLSCACHYVAFRLAGVETRQAVSEGADGLQFFGRTAEGGAHGVAIVNVAGHSLGQVRADGTEHPHVARFVNQDGIARLSMDNPVEVFLREPII